MKRSKSILKVVNSKKIEFDVLTKKCNVRAPKSDFTVPSLKPDPSNLDRCSTEFLKYKLSSMNKIGVDKN